MFDDILGIAEPKENPNTDLPVTPMSTDPEEKHDCGGQCDGSCDCDGHDPTGISNDTCADCGNTFDDCDCDESEEDENDVWDADEHACDGCNGC
jgi:hypothetical protein